MSPRGVVIPGLREQLFAAAERVLIRAGPNALTGRAITREANCATGLLYNHFGDLEQFLTALVVHRFRLQAEEAAALPARAGSGSVTENLTGALLSLFDTRPLAIANLVIARPDLRAPVEAAMAAGAPGLPEVTDSIAAYLDAEREHGRLSASTDTRTVAVALVGTVHHLLLSLGREQEPPGEVIRRLIPVLLGPAIAAEAT